MKTSMKRKILVTNALTYANGDLHLGHLIGYIQPDIWVRFQKMAGNECYFICGSDCHGTPIMLQAEKEGLSSEEMVAKIKLNQEYDCKKFLVNLDYFGSTHSPANKTICEEIYNKLTSNDDIVKKDIEQFYDQEKNIFLPDRYVKGTCPKCNAPNQYGDSCEVCSATYDPTDLINPISVISNTAPIKKTSGHYFFKLANYTDKLKNWMCEKHLQPQVINKMQEWFADGLKNWDISRDAPYFGFEIPNADNKYFYVWFDAPIGYIAIFKDFCAQHNKYDFQEYWQENTNTELYQFLGKDIMYFHALFWPALLMGAGKRLPTKISTHGFLTINGEKMSKSRGTFIKARDYLKYFDPECLRYYLASKLTARIEDIDLNFTDFRLRINSDLVGKIINIASRCAGFINKNFQNKLSTAIIDENLINDFQKSSTEIFTYYEEREFAKIIRKVTALADITNQYIDKEKPWQLIKNDADKEKVHAVCTLGLNLFRLLMIYLKPILPGLAEKSESFLNVAPFTCADANSVLLNHAINNFQPMLQRIDEQQTNDILNNHL